MTEVLSSESIIENFGLQYHERLYCVPNAIINTARILLNDSQANPRIYFHEPTNHAYILYAGQVLNGNVTAPPGLYPDISPGDLVKKGHDSTKDYLGPTVRLFENGETESNQFPWLKQKIMEVFDQETLSTVIPMLAIYYQKIRQETA